MVGGCGPTEPDQHSFCDWLLVDDAVPGAELSVRLPVGGFEVLEVPSALEDELSVIATESSVEGDDDVATVSPTDSHGLLVMAIEVVGFRLAQTEEGNA